MQYWKHNTFFIRQACVLAYDYTGSKEEIKTLYLLLSVAHGKRVTGSSRAHSWSSVSIIKMACHSLGYSILQDSYSKAQSPVYWELMCYEIPAWSAFLWLWGVVSVSLVSMRIIAHHVSSSSLSQTFRSCQPSANCTSVRDRHVLLPCYWPKQSDGLSTSHSLCSLPLRAGQKTSICSSTSVQTAATEDTAKHGFSDTQHHTGLLHTVSAYQCYQMINKPF